MRKPAAAIAAALITSAVGIGAALAAPAPKVTLCHATASVTNPYVAIKADASSWERGHLGDFLLQEGKTCADGPALPPPPPDTSTTEATTTVPDN